MSDTPLTDAEVDDVSVNGVSSRDAIVSANFAREIERELNRYKAAVEKLCEGMAPNCDCLRCRKVREVQASLERSA